MEIRPTPDREERERRRAGILVAIDEAEGAIGRSEGIAINSESMRELAEDVKSRGRARLAGERQALR